MGIYKYIKMTFFDDIKKSGLYMSVLILSIIVVFNIFNITLNEQIISRGSDEYKSISALSFIIMFVSIVFTVFANSYYMEEKYKEYAIISISGRKIGDICKIMLVRSFVVTGTSVLAGCFLGWLISPCIIRLLNEFIEMKLTTIGISRDAVIITILLMFSELEVIFLVNIGSVYRSNITKLINRSKKNYVQCGQMFRLNSIIYGALYVMPLIVIILPIEPGNKVQYIKTASIIGLFGIQGLIRYVIPDWIKYNRNNKGIVDKHKIIELSNLYVSIQKSIVLILTVVLTIILSIEIGIGYESGSLINNISVFCYILIAIIMSCTLVYKFLIEAKSRKSNFEQLKLIGYTIKDIRKIVSQEVKYYYLIVLLLVMPYNIILITGNTMAGLMSISRALFMIIIYIIVFLMSALISYKGYSRVVFKKV